MPDFSSPATPGETPPGKEPALAAVERLREWSRDEIHVGQSVRYHEPTYRNPGEIRRDVRDTIQRLDDALDLCVWVSSTKAEIEAALLGQLGDDHPLVKGRPGA